MEPGLRRAPDWATRLHLFLEETKTERFAYGSYDCCLFVCDAIAVMTGVDVAAPFRGAYRSRRQAYRAIADYAGAPSVERVTERVTEQHGMQEIRPVCAQRGDVLLIPRRHDYSLALVGLDGAPRAATDTGYQRVSLKLATRAWRV